MNTSEAYRHACEVRFVASKNADWRQTYYEAVTKARGEAAARTLAAAVKALLQSGAER
ncbi:MAG: hypothetical protein NUV63_05695 [Gallionella sp.]|nr:hypothetical protein [Gallionella sp.]